MDSEFKKAWELMTFEFRDFHGGLGSCLHKDEDGVFIAYARWPSRALWENEKNIVNIAALEKMRECLEQTFPAIPLEVVNDLLVN